MKDWQAFISGQAQDLAEQNFICDADELGLILVGGEDAREFLQNQLSNDIDLIDENNFQMSSYSTPKGRMLAIFRVIQISNGYLLLTPKSLVLPVIQRLQSYVVRSRVTLADACDYFARFAIQTDNKKISAHSWLADHPGGCFQNDVVVTLQLTPLAGQARFLLLCLDLTEARRLWTEFAEILQVSGYSAWRLAEIKAGIPVIYSQTSEQFVLQMSNLNLLGGVSFKKGCFPGQEIVARMQYLGTLKRRMFLAKIETDQLPQPGDELVAQGKNEIDGSGKVVDATFDGNGYCYLLYIAQIAKAEQGQLYLFKQPERDIQNLELPYLPVSA